MSSQLKMSFQEDIETLKKLNLDILPAKIYYLNLLLTFLLIYLSILSAQAIACLFALNIGALSGSSETYIEIILGIIASSCFFMLLVIRPINHYVIFKLQIQQHLKTGEYLAKKIKLAYKGFIILFLIFSCFFYPVLGQDMAFFGGIPAFIFSGLITTLVINMETNRIGVSLLSTAISKFFQKREEAAAKNT